MNPKNGYDRYLEYQLHMSGSFFAALFDTITRADEGNLNRLTQSFPEEVEAYKTFTRIGLQEFLAKCTSDSELLKKVLNKEYFL
jgi:hypothetical protein